MLVYVELPEVVYGEVPQHVRRGRGVEGIQDHTPDDEESVLVVYECFRSRVARVPGWIRRTL